MGSTARPVGGPDDSTDYVGIAPGYPRAPTPDRDDRPGRTGVAEPDRGRSSSYDRHRDHRSPLRLRDRRRRSHRRGRRPGDPRRRLRPGGRPRPEPARLHHPAARRRPVRRRRRGRHDPGRARGPATGRRPTGRQEHRHPRQPGRRTAGGRRRRPGGHHRGPATVHVGHDRLRGERHHPKPAGPVPVRRWLLGRLGLRGRLRDGPPRGR